MDDKTLGRSFEKNKRLIEEAVQITKNEDMKIRSFRIAGRQAAYVFIDGMVDLTRVQLFVMDPCMAVKELPADEELADFITGQVIGVDGGMGI